MRQIGSEMRDLPASLRHDRDISDDDQEELSCADHVSVSSASMELDSDDQVERGQSRGRRGRAGDSAIDIPTSSARASHAVTTRSHLPGRRLRSRSPCRQDPA